MTSATPNMPMASAAKLMPSASAGIPKVKRMLAGIDVGADQAEQQAEHHHGDRLAQRAARQHHRADQAEHHQREVVGGPNFSAISASGGENSATTSVATLPAMNEAIAAMPSAGPARPCLAI